MEKKPTKKEPIPLRRLLFLNLLLAFLFFFLIVVGLFATGLLGSVVAYLL